MDVAQQETRLITHVETFAQVVRHKGQADEVREEVFELTDDSVRFFVLHFRKEDKCWGHLNSTLHEEILSGA